MAGEAPKSAAAAIAQPKDVSKEPILMFSTRESYYLSLGTTKRGLVPLANGTYEPRQLGVHRHIQFNLHRATHWQDAEGTEYPLTAADLAVIRKKHLYGTDFAEAYAPDDDAGLDPKRPASKRTSSSLYFTRMKQPMQFQTFCREANRRDSETKRIGHIEQWEIEREVQAVKEGTYFNGEYLKPMVEEVA